jgi:hypothetical protein
MRSSFRQRSYCWAKACHIAWEGLKGQAPQAKMLTKDEARGRRIATDFQCGYSDRAECARTAASSASTPGLTGKRAHGSGRQDTRARHQGGCGQAEGGPRRAPRGGARRRPLGRLATGRDMLWSPTIRVALLAETPWLDVFCPGCGTSRAIDLRTVDRHPLASVGTMVLGLRCSWFPGSAPMPKADVEARTAYEKAV